MDLPDIHKTTIPKYQCPFPECTYETKDVKDELAAVLLSVHSTGTHSASPASAAPAATKVEKVRRPTVSAGGSSEEWSYFLTCWQDYVEATIVMGKDRVVQPLECCDEQLRKDLTRNTGDLLTNKTVDEVMAAIKKLAVREENTMVARVQLHNMKQDQDETIFSFGTRLHGQASICKFTIKCPTCEADVNFTENILRDVLTRCLADSEIQLDLLGDKNQDMALEEVFQFIEAKEAGKWSAGRLSDTLGANAARSQYRRGKQGELKQCKAANNNKPCTYCRRRGHGKNAPPKVRKTDCPAYGVLCDHCNRPNHFETVCRSKTKPRNQPPHPSGSSHGEAEGAVFDALGTATSLDQDRVSNIISLDHHLYNHLNDRWVRKASKHQPIITLTATVNPADYTALGYKPITAQPKTIRLSAIG